MKRMNAVCTQCASREVYSKHLCLACYKETFQKRFPTPKADREWYKNRQATMEALSILAQLHLPLFPDQREKEIHEHDDRSSQANFAETDENLYQKEQEEGRYLNLRTTMEEENPYHLS